MARQRERISAVQRSPDDTMSHFLGPSSVVVVVVTRAYLVVEAIPLVRKTSTMQ